MSNENFDLWKAILTTSEIISEATSRNKISRDDLVQQLNAVEEVFAKTIDPSEDFHGYVILHLCKSLKRSIQQL
jgi:predicted transcriptional regulator